MVFILLILLISISAAIHIRAEYQNNRLLIYIFKPLTTSLIILTALLQPIEVSAAYRNLIILGLFFSLGGDIFLMMPSDKFLYGLISFLITHLFYISAFISESGFSRNFFLLLPGIAAIGIILKYLLPHTGRKTIPVIIYAAILTLLYWQSIGRMLSFYSHSSLIAFIGSMLFIFSDSTLVIDRFVKKFKLARLLVLSTYFASQTLIAFSI
jgi:uncharacterized membrane protein YhhN